MIARPVLVSFLNNVAGAGIGFVVLNFASAYGGKDPWGMWLYAVTIAGLVYFATGFGFASAHVKHVSAGYDEARANATYLLVKLALTAFFVLLVVGGILAWTRLLGHPLEQDVTERVIWLAVAYHAVVSLRQFFDYTLQAHRLIVRAESILLVDNLFSLLGVTTAAQMAARLGVVYVRDGLPTAVYQNPPFPAWADAAIRATGLEGPISMESGALLLGAGYLLGKFVSLGYAAFQFFIHRHPIGHTDAETFRRYLAYAKPLALVAFLSPMIAVVDRFFVGFFGTQNELAEYHVAFSLIGPIPVVASAVGTLLFPAISHLQSREERQRIHDLFLESERYLTMITLAPVVVSTIFALQAVRVVTSGVFFDDAAWPLILLAGYSLFFSIAAPSRSLLLGLGRSGVMARYGVLNAVLIVGLNLLLVPPQTAGLGGAGAAIASSLTAFFGYLYLRRHARRELDLPWGTLQWRRQFAAALVAGAILFALSARGVFDSVDRLLELLLLAAASGLLYVLVLAAFRGFTRRDLARLWDLVHPGRFGSYVRDEMMGRKPPQEGPPRSG